MTVLDDTHDVVPKAWGDEWSETELLILLAIKLQVIAKLRAGPASYGTDLQVAIANKDNVEVILKEQERPAKHIVKEIGDGWGGRR